MRKEDLKWKRRLQIYFSLIVLFLFSNCSCKKKPTENNVKNYDPRNISRTETESNFPDLAIDDFGNIHVVWQEVVSIYPENYEIFYRMKNSQGKWSEIKNISNTEPNSLGMDIEVDKSGNIYVTWEDGIGLESGGIYFTEKRRDGKWENPVNVLAGPWYIINLGVDELGECHLVFMGSVPGLHYLKKNSSGNWGQRIDIPGPSIGAQNNRLWVSRNGEIHIVYEDSGYDNNIFYIYSSDGVNWSQPLNLTPVDKYYFASDIIGNDRGNIYVAFSEWDTGKLYFIMKDSSGNWGNLEEVPGVSGYSWLVNLAIDDEGTVYLVWSQWMEEYPGIGPHSRWDIFYTYRDREGNWGTPQNISNTLDASTSPSAEVHPSGKMCVVWCEANKGEIFYDEIILK